VREFVPAPDGSGAEILVGTTADGSVYRIDSQTGEVTQIGSFGGGLTSSGDVVSVIGFGTVATVKKPGGAHDYLASLDTGNGQATLIGDTGFVDIWGLGFWKGQIYGFTSEGQFVLIDPTTGGASLQQQGQVGFWGAGVTTVAPAIR
jgi:hypothetical protein